MAVIWLWLAIGVLIVFWIVWPSGRRRLPVLLLVRNRAEEIEGVLRQILATGCEVHVLVRDSGDESWAIVHRLAGEYAAVVAIRGDVDEGLDDSGLAAAVLIRLDDGRPARAVLQQAGF